MGEENTTTKKESNVTTIEGRLSDGGWYEPVKGKERYNDVVDRCGVPGLFEFATALRERSIKTTMSHMTRTVYDKYECLEREISDALKTWYCNSDKQQVLVFTDLDWHVDTVAYRVRKMAESLSFHVTTRKVNSNTAIVVTVIRSY